MYLLTKITFFALAFFTIYHSVSGACTENSCVHGQCNNDQCRCDPNWFGGNCTTFICEKSNPCLNRGKCNRVGEGNDFTCTCRVGYTGPLCDCKENVTLCPPTNTIDCYSKTEQGVCVLENDVPTCKCADGVGGVNCSEVLDFCTFYGCRNGGICNRTNYDCDCPAGYDKIEQCERPLEQYDLCVYSPCQNNGTCTNPVPIDIVNGPYYICDCQPGFTGQNCSVPVDHCNPTNPCQNGGICSELPNFTSYQCTCPPYYTGDQCQTYIDPCQSANCLNNGVCLSNYTTSNGSYEYSTKCNCTSGFHGDICEIDYNECTSDDNPCQNNSTCINLYGSYKCICTGDTTGVHCESNIDDCISNPCSNGGVCIDGINSYTCNCTGTGFSGHTCTFPNNQSCTIHGCHYDGICQYDNMLGHHKCVCQPGYTGQYCLYKYQSCIAAGCNVSGTHYCTANNTCVCLPGYTGLHCDTVLTDPCDNNQCNAGSTCLSINSTSYTCICQSGYTGVYCNVPIYESCNEGTCQNGGSCLRYYNMEGNYCLCPAGWGGRDCSLDIDECFLRPCQNGGTCNNTMGGYTCSCLPGFTGKNCDIINGSCDTVKCQNGGNCTISEGGVPQCECENGFVGSFCEREVCPYTNCTQLANNGHCDLHCFNAACNYDGGHDKCYIIPDSDPWRECSISSCRTKFKDGYCDQPCNNGPCLYDGNDCIVNQPEGCPIENVTTCSSLINNGVCDEQCNTLLCHLDTADCTSHVYLSGYLVLTLASTSRSDFTATEMDNFKAALSRLINAEVIIISYKELQRNEISDTVIHHTNTSRYWQVTMQIDIQYCIQNCPTSIQQVLNTVQAAYSTGRTQLADFYIANASVQPEPEPGSPGPPSTEIIAFVVTVSVCMVLVLIVVCVLGKRVRDNGGIKETVKKIKTRGVWFVPGGNTPEPDTPPQTREPSFASDRRSMSTEFILVSGGSSPGLERKTTHRWKPLKVQNSEGASCVIGEYRQDSRKWTHLHCEAARQSIDTMELLANSNVEELNAKGPGGFTPLMIAIISDDREASMRRRFTPVRSDSSSGSEPSEHELLVSRSPKLQHTLNNTIPGYPFHYRGGSHVTAFISQQVDVNAVNDYGQSALHLAAKHGRDDYILQLMYNKADPNLQDMWGHTPLHVSIGAATDRAFKALIDYHPKTSVELKSQGGITPLMMCVKMSNISMLQQLLSKGTDISTTDNEGRNAIHWAAMINNIDALRLLIKQGPDNLKDAPNGRGETALFLACREGCLPCVKYLLFECYANATLLDSLDRSPLQVAFEKQHTDIVELLHQANQSNGIQPPPPMYTAQKLSSTGLHNPLYSRASNIKSEPGLQHSHILPSYTVPTTSTLPVPMSLPYHLPMQHHSIHYPSLPSVGVATSQQVTMTAAQENSLHRVSSIEAELEQLVSSAISYPNYSNPSTMLSHPSPPYSNPSPPVNGSNIRIIDSSLSNQRSPGHCDTSISPKVQDYSPVSNQSPLIYPTVSTTQDGLHPLQHLPYHAVSSFIQEPSTSTLSSVEQTHPLYNSALQNIGRTHPPGGHSPPIAQTVSPNPLPHAPPTGYSSHVGMSAENNSPLSGYHGFPSPPKEAGEYSYVTAANGVAGSTGPPQQTIDIVNSLTPSPEDYSNQLINEGSPPQAVQSQCQQQAILQGHYAYEYTMQQPTQFEFHTQLATTAVPSMVTYNAAARHESTV